MGRFTRRLSLGVEHLEPRATPAALVTVGPTSGTVGDADVADDLLAVSGDGGAILFASKATNLVAGVTDNNADYDLFWRDLKAGTTKLVTAQAGTGNAIGFGSGSAAVPLALRAVLSHDGQRVAFVSGASAAAVTGDAAVQDQLATYDVFLWRADTGAAKLVSVRAGENAAVGNQSGVEALDPAISDDGRFVAYGTALDGAKIDTSTAIDNGNTTYDLFVRDTTAADPTKATTAATRVFGKADLVGKFGSVDRPVGRYLSGDGRVVVFSTSVGADLLTGAADQPNSPDVFARDMTVTTPNGGVLVSVTPGGAALGNVAGQLALAPVVARGGAAVVFAAKALGGEDAKQLVPGYDPSGAPTDLYARLTPFGGTPATKLVTAVTGTTDIGANGFLEQPAPGTPATYQVSADGKFVAFVSGATNLVEAADDRNGVGLDVFVRDTALAKTEAASVGKDGKTGSTPADRPSLSDDGRYVAFVSAAPELGLIAADENGTADAFLRDRLDGTTRPVSTTPNGQHTGDGATTAARVSADGKGVVLVSRATNLTADPLAKAVAQVYLAPLPLAPVVGGGGKVAVVSGPADGTVRTYSIDAAGRLTPIGNPFPAFPGVNTQTRVAAGDVNGDGAADTIAVVGPRGGSLVRVIDGLSGKDLVPPVATYEPTFTGGLFVATADIDGDGKAEIVLSPDVGGGARVQVYSFNVTGLVQRANFFGIADPNFRGGGRVAAGDLNGDGKPEVIVGAGFGGGPRVAVYDGATLFSVAPGATPPKLFGDFFAFPGPDSTRLRNGVFVAAGDVNGDEKADLIFGGGPGGGPRVLILDSAVLTTATLDETYGKPLANFFAFDAGLRGGVRVAVKDLDADDRADLLVGSGEKSATQVRTYLGKNIVPAGDPAAFEVIDPFGAPGSAGGVFVG